MILDNLPPLDIKTFMKTAVYLLFLISFYNFFRGIRRIKKASELGFYSIRRNHIVKGWRLIFDAFLLLIFAFLVNLFGEPVAYTYIPITNTIVPTATLTLTPTITLTPTLTLTSSITPTLAISYTPSPTFTPNIPAAIEVQFEGDVEPPADAAFSPIVFSQSIDALYQPIHPNTIFENPVVRIYANFSYAQLANGVQWTALWYRGGELVYFETQVWDGGSGGYGYSDWEPDSSQWLPGNYIVHIFLGLQIKASANFELVGDAATETMTPTITNTVTNTSTPTITITPSPTITLTATQTRAPLDTPITPSATSTRAPTYTPETPFP